MAPSLPERMRRADVIEKRYTRRKSDKTPHSTRTNVATRPPLQSASATAGRRSAQSRVY
jgi:hypothetical protein